MYVNLVGRLFYKEKVYMYMWRSYIYTTLSVNVTVICFFSRKCCQRCDQQIRIVMDVQDQEASY